MSNTKDNNTVKVLGVFQPVPLNTLIKNEGYRLANDPNETFMPRLCTRDGAHDTDACTMLHRRPEEARRYVLIHGEPAPVSIADLVENAGLARLRDHGVTGEKGAWCTISLNDDPTHDIARCPNIHLGRIAPEADANLTVLQGSARLQIPLSELLFNRGAHFLLTHEGTEGVMCNNQIPHERQECRFLHRRIEPGSVLVRIEGEYTRVPLDCLATNPASRYLASHPDETGHWCTTSGDGSDLAGTPTPSNHDAATCEKLHWRHATVDIDGKKCDSTLLEHNAGLRFLLLHPTSSGRVCNVTTHKSRRDLAECPFIHMRLHNARAPHFTAGTGRGAPLAAGDRALPLRRSGGGGGGGRNYNDDNNNNYNRGGGGGGRRGGRGGRNNNNNNNNRYDDDEDEDDNSGGYYNNNNNNRRGGRGGGGGGPRTVNVAGKNVPVNELEKNRGLQFLLDNPGQQGRWCRDAGKLGHPVGSCTFLHRR